MALDFWHIGILGLMGVFNNAAALWTNGQNFVSSLGKTTNPSGEPRSRPMDWQNPNRRVLLAQAIDQIDNFLCIA